MELGKIARAKSLPHTKNRGQRLTLTVVVALVIFVTAFVLGLMCGWAWRRRL